MSLIFLFSFDASTPLRSQVHARENERIVFTLKIE